MDKDKFLTKEDIGELLSINEWIDKNIYVVEFKSKFMLLKKIGKCNPKKCNKGCCRIIDANHIRDYSKGFFDEVNEFGKYILKRNCNNLDKCGKCKLWRNKMPRACKQFPHPSDSIYWYVMDKCTFKFKILWEILKIGNSVRAEMIRNFENQGELK